MMSALVEVRDLAKRYGAVAALDGVSLDVSEGEWVSVMGPSGSGKSTLLHLIAGLESPTSGTVRVAGTDIGALDPEALAEFRASRVGLVFQRFHMVPYLTVLENVMVAQYLHSAADAREARAALDRVGLADRTSHLPSQLSGGERQRACIARALVNHPALLLADEPTGNLDEENENRVVDLLRDLHAEGRTILLVTHDPDIGRLAGRRVVLSHGKLLSAHAARETDEEYADEILESLWKEDEAGAPRPAPALPEAPGSLARTRGTLDQLAREGLIERAERGFRLVAKGRVRARGLVRRHRLAEKLFLESFRVDRDAMQASACEMEHILSPEVTDSICAFLRHPEACPHGKPIPPGHCCPRYVPEPAGEEPRGVRPSGRNPAHG